MVTEVSFPGYGPEPSVALAAADRDGNLLLIDAPWNPSTSVSNAHESALAAYRRQTGRAVTRAWAYSGLDGYWPIDLAEDQWASERGPHPDRVPFLLAARRALAAARRR